MSVNLKNKYKERSPEETISIVQNFFESRGYDFEFILDQQSEA